MRTILAVLALVASSVALAVPGTYTVTPTAITEDGTGGTPDGFRLYQGCDLAAGTTGAMVADNIAINNGYQFTGNTDTPPVVCVVPYNSAGEGTFANVVSLDSTQNVPGAGTITLTCSFVADTGEIYNCSGTVSQ